MAAMILTDERMAEVLLPLVRYRLPGLYANGTDTPVKTPIDPIQVAHCVRWIGQYMFQRKTVNPRSSYALKHAVENAAGTYISNGAFIAAAVGLGYQFQVPPLGCPNVCFRADYADDVKSRKARKLQQMRAADDAFDRSKRARFSSSTVRRVRFWRQDRSIEVKGQKPNEQTIPNSHDPGKRQRRVSSRRSGKRR
jgi:hypothetical protein